MSNYILGPEHAAQHADDCLHHDNFILREDGSIWFEGWAVMEGGWGTNKKAFVSFPITKPQEVPDANFLSTWAKSMIHSLKAAE